MVYSAESIFQVQSLDIVIEDDNFVGMPFVLLSGEKWIKNQGSDFYVDFGAASKPALKVFLLPNLLKITCYTFVFGVLVFCWPVICFIAFEMEYANSSPIRLLGMAVELQSLYWIK